MDASCTHAPPSEQTYLPDCVIQAGNFGLGKYTEDDRRSGVEFGIKKNRWFPTIKHMKGSHTLKYFDRCYCDFIFSLVDEICKDY